MEYLRIKELFKGASRGTDRHGCRAACASKAGMETKSTERKCEGQEMRVKTPRDVDSRQREGRKAPSLGSHGYTRHSAGVRMPVHLLYLSLLTETGVLMDPVSV